MHGSRPRLTGAGVSVTVLTLCVGVSAGLGSTKDPADARGPLDLARADISQSGREITISLRTRGRWRLGDLDRHPESRRLGAGAGAYLCLETRQGGVTGRSCFGAKPDGTRRLATGRVGAGGGVNSYEAADASISRPNRRSVAATLRFGELGLHKGQVAWRALSAWDAEACLARGPAGAPCTDAAPDGGFAQTRIRKPRLIGCTPASGRVIRNGNRKRRAVALTFDDGPSAYTEDVLARLRRAHAKATFFVLGSQIGERRPGLLRQMVRSGHEIANHSYNHDATPSKSDLAATNARVRKASGFTPCTFRPPGGTISDSVDSARELGMSTVLWDVDPSDWSRPGSNAIYSRVVSNVRPGSIVLMHDGGGDRSQTVAALPRIISTLRQRGYHLTTVTRLLRERFRWGP